MAKMPLAEHDNVVKTFPPDRTDRPFTISVLPRRSRRGWPIPNAHRPKATDEDVTVDGVAVNPFSRWVRSHSQPQDLAAIVMQQQPVEHHPWDGGRLPLAIYFATVVCPTIDAELEKLAMNAPHNGLARLILRMS